MQKVISIYKPSGLTPLEVIKKITLQKPELKNVSITYAGRLDPLAHGVLVLLVGEEAKNKNKYLALPKSYKFEIVFGIKTDTYDLLGMAEETKVKQIINVNLFVNTFVNKHIGKQLQFYPPYSSKPVNGKPLFWWAKNNKLNEITLPKHEIEIYDFTCLSLGEIAKDTLKLKVKEAVRSVKGDFRQKEIATHWNKLLGDIKTQTFQTATFSINCSRGTYIRELVHQLGETLGCGAVAINILRTSVGEFTVENAEKLH